MNSNIRSAYPDTEHPESYRVVSWRFGEIPPKGWIYPREPEWWRDDDAEDRRDAVVDIFDPGDLGTLIEEVAGRLEGMPDDKETIVELIRRHWSLTFFTEIAEASFSRMHIASHERESRRWQLQAARFLTENTWRYVMTLPAPLVDEAILIALVAPYEFDEDDDTE